MAQITYTPLPNGGMIKTEGHGRESYIPETLIFTRKSGKKYIWCGRSINPDVNCILSIDSGQYKEMTTEEFEKFKAN